MSFSIREHIHVQLNVLFIQLKKVQELEKKIYGPWQRVHFTAPLDWPTEVSPTGNNDYTLVGRKDDETIKNVRKRTNCYMEIYK